MLDGKRRSALNRAFANIERHDVTMRRLLMPPAFPGVIDVFWTVRAEDQRSEMETDRHWVLFDGPVQDEFLLWLLRPDIIHVTRTERLEQVEDRDE